MPFKSKAQARKLWATNPTVAQEFANATPNMKSLPEKVKKSKKKASKKK